MTKQTIGRILAIAVVTLVFAKVFESIARALFQMAAEFSIAACDPERGHPCDLTNTDDATNAVMFLGAVFGFWLIYTGRLARIFRKV